MEGNVACARRVLRRRRNASRRNAAGTINMDNNGAVIIPPTMGAATRCMTS